VQFDPNQANPVSYSFAVRALDYKTAQLAAMKGLDTMSYDEEVEEFLQLLGIESDDPVQEVMQHTMQCMGVLRLLNKQHKRRSQHSVNEDNSALVERPRSDSHEDMMELFGFAIKTYADALTMPIDKKMESNAKEVIESFPNHKYRGTQTWLALQWASLQRFPVSTARVVAAEYPDSVAEETKKGYTGYEFAMKNNTPAIARVIDDVKTLETFNESMISISADDDDEDFALVDVTTCSSVDTNDASEASQDKAAQSLPLVLARKRLPNPSIATIAQEFSKEDTMWRVYPEDHAGQPTSGAGKELNSCVKEFQLHQNNMQRVQRNIRSTLQQTTKSKVVKKRTNNGISYDPVEAFVSYVVEKSIESMMLTNFSGETLIEQLGSSYLAHPISCEGDIMNDQNSNRHHLRSSNGRAAHVSGTTQAEDQTCSREHRGLKGFIEATKTKQQKGPTRASRGDATSIRAVHVPQRSRIHDHVQRDPLMIPFTFGI
jgi:hypothetical protein